MHFNKFLGSIYVHEAATTMVTQGQICKEYSHYAESFKKEELLLGWQIRAACFIYALVLRSC